LILTYDNTKNEKNYNKSPSCYRKKEDSKKIVDSIQNQFGIIDFDYHL